MPRREKTGRGGPPQFVATSAPSPASILKAAAVTPTKSRGQNFLVQGAVADRIVDLAELARDDEVIEIGPGLGILSERIIASDVRRLTLVELDRALADRLEQIFADDPRVRLVRADFVRTDISTMVERAPVKIVANLPFNVAGAIFRSLCDARSMISTMVLMFQREVGERIRARPGERAYSALSVFAALYWTIDTHFRVAAGSFFPRPKVDAEVLRFRAKAHLLFEPEEESAVTATVRACFSAPRKKVRNSLAGGLAIGPHEAADYLAGAQIPDSLRPGSLSPEDLVRLARALIKGEALKLNTEARDA